MTATIDFGLSLNHRAWAVLHMLSATCICDVDPKVGLDPYLKTYPWYNGRERGFMLFLRRTPVDLKGLYIVFAEARNSDQIFVEDWEGEVDINPPVVFELRDPRVGYANRKSFNTVDQTSDYILQKLEEFCHTPG